MLRNILHISLTQPTDKLWAVRPEAGRSLPDSLQWAQFSSPHPTPCMDRTEEVLHTQPPPLFILVWSMPERAWGGKGEENCANTLSGPHETDPPTVFNAHTMCIPLNDVNWSHLMSDRRVVSALSAIISGSAVTKFYCSSCITTTGRKFNYMYNLNTIQLNRCTRCCHDRFEKCVISL